MSFTKVELLINIMDRKYLTFATNGGDQRPPEKRGETEKPNE